VELRRLNGPGLSLTAYDEGTELIRRRYDNPETIRRQMQFYRELGPKMG